ncbi:MAG: 3-dehydroquinate synthase [Fidelibacterota bacterium]
MKTISVNLGSHSYDILIEPGLLNKLPGQLAKYDTGQQWIIISQPEIIKLVGKSLEKNLLKRGFYCSIITISNTEDSKSFNQYRATIEEMVRLGCDRSTTILALGGGVTGDLAGFVAATYLRGVDYFQIPTTLLAMVDSAIGGKTGINLPAGKNLVGCFNQPKAVWIDPEILQSLPREEQISGIGEIIKYGAIRDAEFLQSIHQWLDDIEHFPFTRAIERSCEIKREIVEVDEQEENLRMILNFGHTVGHALEAYSGYHKIRHGEAVSYGMLCSGWISEQTGLLTKEEQQFLSTTIHKLPLPTLPFINSNKLLNYITTDKKYRDGSLNYILLSGLGNAVISNQISMPLIAESLKIIQ